MFYRNMTTHQAGIRLQRLARALGVNFRVDTTGYAWSLYTERASPSGWVMQVHGNTLAGVIRDAEIRVQRQLAQAANTITEA